jgi:hypothetical protein
MAKKLPSVRVSLEMLFHFRCTACHHWWSIGDAPKRKKYWFCPWCGTKQSLLKEKGGKPER